MEALAATHFGPAKSVLSFVPASLPHPTEMQLLIKVQYSELNPVDHHKLGMKKSGTTVPSHRSPFIVGYGGSGTVTKIGSDQGIPKSLLGQRVAFLADPSADGSYATHVAVDYRLVAPVPEEVKWEEAASVPVAGCTALESLEKVGLPIMGRVGGAVPAPAQVSRTLLIVGGAGGVGSWATLLAREAYPELEIVCTASSDESRAWCIENGANRTIGHGEVESLGGGRMGSVDHVICLSEPTKELFASLAEVLRPFGRICLVVAGGGVESLDLSFIFFKSGTVCTETVFSSSRSGFVLDQAKEMGTILDLLARKKLRAPLMKGWDEVGGGRNWKQALEEGGCVELVGSGHCRGKLVMRVGNE